MDSINTDLEPVHLPYWPTCKNALTWSTEDLAVATGELVHILTPRDSSKPQDVVEHRDWHISTLRVNRFEENEWPLQELAPIAQFSLGEELSDSTVVSIAWSSSGIARYKRSLLAVLTSNLVLSLWETNGKPGEWQRTCIVNQHLPTGGNNEVEDKVRLRTRVRAFTWLSSLGDGTDSSERERQILAVADDDYTISFLEVRKTTGMAQRQWSIDCLLQHKVIDQDHSKSQATNKQSLRSILAHSSPVSGLDAGEWEEDEVANGIPTLQTSVIKVSLGQCRSPEYLHLQVRHSTADPATTERGLELSVQTLTFSSDDSLPRPPSEDVFELALQKPRLELDRNLGLGGKVCVTYWGTAWSPKRTIAAACVSLHPSDLIDPGIPSTQRTTVLFVRIQDPLLSEDRMNDPVKIQEGIFEFMVDTSAGLDITEFDKKILRNAASLMKLNFSKSTDLIDSVDSWLETRLTPISGDEGNQMDVDDAETEKENTAIEERQFLDLGKMEFQGAGPSLSQALFDKFDVCPYCQAKFRG
ncbi:hypothetical protein H2200_005565 [Cladophialophora chaetospira]|uniref:Transcription factor IIIC 90kDa subunit N-terminal domain-containing protein n=1 Tax=Cladophialophora chaetospira TaxID=386627 RepID=A0AA38XC84_9EURO|nr:hypothetical protein H2200_005565 [Cladophialophora chaetospira]